MKTKHLPLFVMLMLTALNTIAQNATDKKISMPDISFGKKLPPPELMNARATHCPKPCSLILIKL